MSIDSSTISVPDAGQTFEHFTGELNNWYGEVAQKTANKVCKISLKFIIEPSATLQDLANPEILITGAKPIWTKQATSHDIKLSVQDNKLVVDRTFNTFAKIIPQIQTAQSLQVHAKAFIPPGGAWYEAPDPILAAEKIWNYSVKN